MWLFLIPQVAGSLDFKFPCVDIIEQLLKANTDLFRRGMCPHFHPRLMMKRQETAKRSVILPGSILCKAISLQFLECRQYTQAADLITDVSYPLACSSVVGTEDHNFSRMFQLHQLSQDKRFLLTHTAAVWNRSIACGQCGQKLFLACILGQVNQRLIISGKERFSSGFWKCVAACFEHVIIQLW